MSEDRFLQWLLSAETPIIRYRTLTDLLHHSADHPAVVQAKAAIMTTEPIPSILANQTEDGHQAGENNYYQPKYRSTHWSMLLLSELGVDPANTQFQRGVHFMLDSLAPKSAEQSRTGNYSLACLFGNCVRYAVYAGRLHDRRTMTLIRSLIEDLQNGFCACPHNGGLSCAWGVVRILYGLAAIPAAERTIAVNVAVEQALGFLLEQFSLLEANYPPPPDGKTHPLWFRLNFPLQYQVDILLTLRVLGELNALDHPGAQPALDWLEAQRMKNGHWRGSSPYRSRTWPLGEREETNRFVSLQTATVLQQAGRFLLPDALPA